MVQVSLLNLSRKNILTPNIWKESLNWIESLINAMDIREYSTKEITDAETIERLHKYDMDAIDMDAEVFIFMEHRPATSHYIELYDVTIRRSWSVEDEEWNENLSQEERDKEMKFVRTCVGLD